MAPDLVRKVQNRGALALLQLKLKTLSLMQGDCVVDYGWIRLPFSNDGDLQELYYHQNCRQYYDHDIAVLREHIKPGDTVVDVGANLGFVAAMMASLVGTNGKVYAFEPLEPIFKKLRRTVELNRLSMIEPVNLGLGDQDAVRDIYRVSRSSGNNTMSATDDTRSPIGQVKITTLDRYFADTPRRISFLKIDTEGYEGAVLRGATTLLMKHRPIIYIELCSEYKSSSMEAIEILASSGYRLPNGIDLETTGNGSNFVAIPGSGPRGARTHSAG